MLYYLFDYFASQNLRWSAVFNYVSTRATFAVIVSLIVSIVIGRQIITLLREKQISDAVRPYTIEGMLSKKGTPTMGGLIILAAILIPTLLFCRLDNIYIILMIIATLWLGGLGFADDYIKVFKKNKEGLAGRYKLIAQMGLGVLVALVFLTSPAVVIKENARQVLEEGRVVTQFATVETQSLQTTIPFVKGHNLDYSAIAPWLGIGQNSELFTIIFVSLLFVFIVMAVSNGANLTDGLDGLCTGSSAIIGVVLGILAYISSHIEMAAYFNVMFIPGAEELVVFAAAFIGATAGFLWFNSFPAQIFMGDTGSLTLGGIIAIFAIVIRKELLLPILCGVFLVETLSVIIQTTYFRYTKRRTGVGKRVFKMTPLHHHYQKPGDGSIDALLQRPYRPIPEAKITTRFWLIGIVLAVLTIATLKFR